MKIILLFCMIFMLNTSTFGQEPQVIRVDPYYAMGGTAGQIFQEVNYIPLETTKESLFGRINQLLVTKDYYIILDQHTNCVLFFFKNGKYHAKINGGNTGTKENLLYNITLNPDKEELLVRQPHQISTYSFDGKKLREEKSKSLTWPYFLKKNRTITASYYPEKTLKDSIKHELQFKEDGKVYLELLPYNQKTDVLAADSYYYSPSHPVLNKAATDSTAIYWRPYDYQIHEVSPQGLKTKYKFIFPLAMSLPENFLNDSSYVGKRVEFLDKNKQIIQGISNFYQMGSNLFFKTPKSNTTDNAFIYNLKSGKLISITKISPDSSSAYLPIVSPGSEFLNNNFHTRDEQYLYTSIPSLFIFRSKEATVDKKPVYPPALKTYFETRNNKDNPVLIQLKPKDQL